MHNDFRVELRRTDRGSVLAVSGEVDLASSPALEEALQEADGAESSVVVLDLREVEFMDSAGLAVVVKAHQRARRAGKRFGLVNRSPQVRRLLSLTGMDERMTMAQTPEELLEAG